jgi:hypothetical protein
MGNCADGRHGLVEGAAEEGGVALCLGALPLCRCGIQSCRARHPVRCWRDAQWCLFWLVESSWLVLRLRFLTKPMCLQPQITAMPTTGLYTRWP